MKIVIDISPLHKENLLKHAVRGSGFYIEYLRRSLSKYYPENTYLFFSEGEDIPNDVDVIHYPFFEPFFLSLPLKRKKKTVVTVHDLIPLVFPKEFPSGIKGKLRWKIQKFLLQSVDEIITDSYSSRNDIVRFTGISESKINVVYLAPADHFKPISNKEVLDRVRKKYHLPDTFLLYVGDATWNKNLPRLLQAVKTVGIPLVLVGKVFSHIDVVNKNPWNKDLIEVNNLLKDLKNKYVLGFIPDEDLVAIYNLATVFCMVSLYEGFGLPMLEAMACGCPVVASSRGSLAEIGGDAAMYIDPYSLNSIADGIYKVVNDKKLRKLISNKGIENSKKFSWKETASNTVSVYKKAFYEK